MGHRIDETSLDRLFREARTYSKWQSRPVTDDTLRDLYELLKWAPTSANAAPARFAFLRSMAAKKRLRPALAPLNIEKTMTAPVTVIVGYDLKFYDHLPKLFPQSPGIKQLFESNPELVEATAKRNSSLQGAYLIMAARALGLDCGPMSGFDPAKVDEEFFAAGKPCFGCEQEFFPKAMSSRISSVTSGTVNRVRHIRDSRACRSTKRVRSSSGRAKSFGHHVASENRNP
jgi:3-hydroxypropanoate dehydrogenase